MPTAPNLSPQDVLQHATTVEHSRCLKNDGLLLSERTAGQRANHSRRDEFHRVPPLSLASPSFGFSGAGGVGTLGSISLRIAV